jgi:CRP/FNR family transcriptional regulator, cyclic AMP receptor protein
VSDAENTAALLRSLPVLNGLPADEIENLAALSEPFSIRAGEVLFEEGDPADSVFVLGSGEMEALKRLPGDRAVAASKFGPGHAFGELAMIAGMPRVVTARAVQDTAGVAVDARAVQQLLAGTDPGARELAFRLGRAALGTLRFVVDRIVEALDSDPRASEPPPEGGPRGGEVTAVEPEAGETEYLRSILFFNRFTPAQLDELFGGLRRLAAPRGTELLAEGERGDALLFVLRGAVESTLRHGGAAARVRLSGPGRIVTHLGVVDEQPCPYTCTTRERAVLLELPLPRLQEIRDSDHASTRLFKHGVYQDIADAIVHANRPLARMAAADGRGS